MNTNDLLQSPGLLLLAASTLILAACAPAVGVAAANIDLVDVTETLTISQEWTEDTPAEVNLSLNGGTLYLAAGDTPLVEGTVKYNVPDWEPIITARDKGINVEQHHASPTARRLRRNEVNRWDLKLGQIPVDLTLNLKAYAGQIDLSGIPIHQLTIVDGAGAGQFHFDSVNPIQMEKLTYTSGGSTTTLSGLSNANASDMFFRCVGGSCTLDFAGQLQRDTQVHVVTGLGHFQIEVPATTATQITLEGNFRGIQSQGPWQVEDNIYTTSGTDPLLTILVEMDLGNIDLVSK